MSPLVLFIDSIVRFASSGAAFADSLERNRMFCVSHRSFIDSIVCFAGSGAVFADSLEGIEIE